MALPLPPGDDDAPDIVSKPSIALTGWRFWRWSLWTWISRGDSLRAIVSREVGLAIGRPGIPRRWWDEQPRRFLLVASAALLALTVIPPWSAVPVPSMVLIDAPTLIAIGTAGWASEAALFVFTAAVTAIIVSGLPDASDRQAALTRYRAQAFDAAAALSLAVLLLTGAGLTQVATEGAQHKDVADWLIRLSLLFVLDVAASGWLLYWAHRIVSDAPRERIPSLVRQLRRSLQQSVEREASQIWLRRWAGPYGLQLEADLFGHPRVGWPVTTDGRLVVRDIRLAPLARWLKSLRGDFGGGVKAVTSLRLNVVVLPGWPIATVSDADRTRASGVLRSIRRGTEAPNDEFSRTLMDITDRAASAARDARLGEFQNNMDALAAVYMEMYRLRGRVAHLRADLVTALTGWQPEAEFGIRLRRLGHQVLDSPAEFVVSRWLYFVQELLVDSRPHVGRDLDLLFSLWTQVARLPERAAKWDFFWQRLNEYSTNVNMWFDRALTVDALTSLARERERFLVALRWIIVSVGSSCFPLLVNAVFEVGRGLDTFRPPTNTPATNIDATKQELAHRLDRFKRLFWLGYAGWMFNRVERGLLDHEMALVQWPTIRGAFTNMGEALDAWRTIGRGDEPYQWDWEEQRDQMAAAQAQGHRISVGYSDSYARTTVPFVLLALSLAPYGALPEDAEARALMREIEPVLNQILADEQTWGPYVD
jgi:hypothetical protein